MNRSPTCCICDKDGTWKQQQQRKYLQVLFKKILDWSDLYNIRGDYVLEPCHRSKVIMREKQARSI